MRRLPGWFDHLDSRGLPIRAILLLSIVFVVITTVTAVFPDLLVSVLTVASSVFLFLYVLCFLSYVRIEKSALKRCIYGAVLLFLLATLASVGLKILYPLVIFLIALFASFIRSRQQKYHLQEAEKNVSLGKGEAS